MASFLGLVVEFCGGRGRLDFALELVVNFLKVGVGDVGVNLRGGDTAVAKHGLHRTQVGTVHYQVGGEAVAQGVRRNVFGNARQLGVIFYEPLYRAGCDAAQFNFALAGDVAVLRHVARVVQE